jgi:adenosylcobinamide-GDP ribazoletransferase
MKRLILMLQFATRFPVPRLENIEENDLQRGMKYLPLAGVMIGVVVWFSYRIMRLINPLAAAVAAVFTEVMVTGGLHQDGLADTFDGLYSNKNREEMLEIMKDSRLGTNGVLAITGVLFLKVALLYVVSRSAVLLVMPVFSRLAMVYGAAFSVSARQSGLGHVFIEGVGKRDALIASLLTVLVTFYFIGFIGSIAVMAVLLAVALFLIEVCSMKIGGMTGDTLGALGEISSVVFLIVYRIIIYF